MRDQSAVKISVVVPVYNTPADVLNACFESVLKQTHKNWELCVCNDSSTSEETLVALNRYRGKDSRIRLVETEKNAHISGASNVAAEQATGEFLAFLDHDDCLHEDALLEIAKAAIKFPDVDLLYTDEDKIAPDGSHTEAYFKPDWSPEHLFSVMYVLHCLTIRKSLFWDLGGFRKGFDGSQDYDLALRACRKARRIVHIPKILYHWRIIPGSAAAEVSAKPYAHDAGLRALNEAIAESGEEGWAEQGLLTGTFRARYKHASPPVTLAILTGYRRRHVEGRGDILLVENFVSSIAEKSTYPNYRILVVDDGHSTSTVRSIAEKSGGGCVSYEGAKASFNFSSKANFAFANIDTEHLILLNDDLEVISPEWIESLLEHSQRREVGAVGPRLLFPDGGIQHAGIVCGINGSAGHVFHRWPSESVGYSAFSHLIRNYSAITGAALATRKSVVEEVGKFDESFPVDFNDVDFCLRIRKAGYRIVYTPYSTLYHFECSSLVRRESVSTDQFRQKWGEVLDQDPYYNPNLPRDRLDFGVPAPPAAR